VHQFELEKWFLAINGAPIWSAWGSNSAFYVKSHLMRLKIDLKKFVIKFLKIIPNHLMI